MKTISNPLYLKPITLLFFISSSSLVLCQKWLENCANSVNDTSIYEEKLTGEFFVPSELHQGPNFYSQYWDYGTIVLENGKMIYNKLINYHLLTGQLFWLRPIDNKQIIVEKSFVKEFTISPNDSSNKSVFRKINIQRWYKADSIPEYLQVLTQGFANLYSFRRAEIGSRSGNVLPISEYYIQINNEQIKRLKQGRRSLYAAIGENKMIMKKIVRGNHLRIRKEEDLIKALVLFNREIKQTKN